MANTTNKDSWIAIKGTGMIRKDAVDAVLDYKQFADANCNELCTLCKNGTLIMTHPEPSSIIVTKAGKMYAVAYAYRTMIGHLKDANQE